MLLLQKDEATAAQRRVPMYLVDSGDGITPETGVTISAGDLKISKNGGAEANHAGTLTEVAGGNYYYEATAGELDTVGYITLRLSKSGIRVFNACAQVVAFDPYDAVRAGLTALPAAAAEAAGGLFTRGTGAGQIAQDSNGTISVHTKTMEDGVIAATKLQDSAITAAKIADNAITAAKLATDAITAAKIAADAITEIQAGLASAGETAALQVAVEDIQARLPEALVSGMMPSYVGGIEAATATAIGTALLDLTDGVETGQTVRKILRGIAAILLGKTSGGPGSTVFRDINNAKDRVTSVADQDGNRTTVTLDLT
jgi:hypothetical protein